MLVSLAQAMEPALLESVWSEVKTEPAFAHLQLAAKLGLLLLKRRLSEVDLTVAALWDRIWRRTDAVYLATESLQHVFKRVMEALVGRLGEGALHGFDPRNDHRLVIGLIALQQP